MELSWDPLREDLLMTRRRIWLSTVFLIVLLAWAMHGCSPFAPAPPTPTLVTEAEYLFALQGARECVETEGYRTEPPYKLPDGWSYPLIVHFPAGKTADNWTAEDQTRMDRVIESCEPDFRELENRYRRQFVVTGEERLTMMREFVRCATEAGFDGLEATDSRADIDEKISAANLDDTTYGAVNLCIRSWPGLWPENIPD